MLCRLFDNDIVQIARFEQSFPLEKEDIARVAESSQ